MEQDHISQAISDWVTTKFRISESPWTEKQYYQIITEFRAWTQREGRDLDPDVWCGPSDKAKRRAIALLASDAQQFANHSKRRAAVSSTTYGLRLSVLASFYDFCNKRDFFDCINPISKLDRPRIRPYGKVKPIEVKDILTSMQKIDRTTKKGARDYVLLAVMLQTGRRLAEVASLRWRHVELASGSLEDLENTQDIRLTLFFERCKGGKTARHELSNRLSVELLKSLGLIYEMNPLYLDPQRPLWPSFTRHCGQPLGRGGVSDVVEKRLGVTSAHRLRHTNAVVLRELGLKLEEIQALLGHENLSTTATYLLLLTGHQNAKVVEMDNVFLGK